jgi:hypothetical protein
VILNGHFSVILPLAVICSGISESMPPRGEVSMRQDRVVGAMTTSSLDASTPGLIESAPEWLRDLAASYQERFGWPVAITERQLVVAIGQFVDAITMPAGLGARVQAQLAIAMLAGPVTGDPDGRYWTFLAQPDPAFRGDLGDVVAACGVRREAVGTSIAVPAKGSGVRWVDPPRPNRTLPSICAVVATTRRVCAVDPGQR